jgi:hypothetical protein
MLQPGRVSARHIAQSTRVGTGAKHLQLTRSGNQLVSAEYTRTHTHRMSHPCQQYLASTTCSNVHLISIALCWRQLYVICNDVLCSHSTQNRSSALLWHQHGKQTKHHPQTCMRSSARQTHTNMLSRRLRPVQAQWQQCSNVIRSHSTLHRPSMPSALSTAAVARTCLQPSKKAPTRKHQRQGKAAECAVLQQQESCKDAATTSCDQTQPPGSTMDAGTRPACCCQCRRNETKHS